MSHLMQKNIEIPELGPELEKALSELIEQTGREPISARLRELAACLAAALERPEA
ncbi:hypothetical protein [Paracoccus ravus]|uniref:hypothetical protein n=1 Tax=Paracoccus ravus TaxID=2447760 RepID=UPI0014311534|nr:hypothetical protein [Paracoccus ravus]